MKLSLSGVWKAYDIHTMNGQSWHKRQGQAVLTVPRSTPLAASTCGHGASPLPRPSALTPVLTRDNMMRSLRARVSPCFILMRFLSKHFMAYLGDKGSLQGPAAARGRGASSPMPRPRAASTRGHVTAPSSRPRPP